ncbi:PH domain-containing protein [bacterium]|nr:PH domain-containing protein [bacterium]MCI0606019.1 PH domain-containing protein [bacterium]
MSYIAKLLGKDEQILLETKRHIFVLLGQFFKEFLVLAALVAGWIVIHGYAQAEFLWIEIVIAAIAVIVLISLFIDWLRWNNEAFFVTNRRVIHSSGVLNKKVLDSSLSKINDVIMEQSFLGRIFDYGTIKILTATEEVINRVDKISRPLEFKKAMMGAKAGLEPLHPAVTSASSAQLLEELAQLKAKNLISEEEYNEKRKEIIKRM